MGNENLNRAKRVKNDEFYTLYDDVKNEILNYKSQLEGRTIYCNCDSIESNFWKFLHHNFKELKLKKLICTFYNPDGASYRSEYDGTGNDDDYTDCVQTALQGDGDFHSAECLAIMKGADIVITNPPFSKFRLFFSDLMENKKEFLIIGSANAISYKDVFYYIKDGFVNIGYNNISKFYNSETAPQCRWFTTLRVNKKPFVLSLTAPFDEHKYQKYDFFDAINCNSIKDIPKNYNGIIGVPITFLDKYPNALFELTDIVYNGARVTPSCGMFYVNGIKKYNRLFIQRKK